MGETQQTTANYSSGHSANYSRVFTVADPSSEIPTDSVKFEQSGSWTFRPAVAGRHPRHGREYVYDTHRHETGPLPCEIFLDGCTENDVFQVSEPDDVESSSKRPTVENAGRVRGAGRSNFIGTPDRFGTKYE